MNERFELPFVFSENTPYRERDEQAALMRFGARMYQDAKRRASAPKPQPPTGTDAEPLSEKERVLGELRRRAARQTEPLDQHGRLSGRDSRDVRLDRAATMLGMIEDYQRRQAELLPKEDTASLYEAYRQRLGIEKGDRR
jgi:hypothetical protein